MHIQLKNYQKPWEEIAQGLSGLLLYVSLFSWNFGLFSPGFLGYSTLQFSSPQPSETAAGSRLMLSVQIFYFVCCKAGISPKGKSSCECMALLGAVPFFTILAPQILIALVALWSLQRFLKILYFEIILDLQKSCKTGTESSQIPCAHLLMLSTYKSP